MEKYIRLRGTRQHLHSCTLIPTGASHKHLHINLVKEKRKRELQLPCCASTHSTTASRLSCLAPLVPRASRASQVLTSTCASQQRPLTWPSSHNSPARLLRSSQVLTLSQAASGVRCFPSSLSLQSSHTTYLSRAPLDHVRLLATHPSTLSPHFAPRPLFDA